MRGEVVLLALIFGVGFYTIIAAYLDWDWFFRHHRARPIVGLFGRQGARVFYILLGGLLVGMGACLLLSS